MTKPTKLPQDWKPLFDDFWSKYPRKVGKLAAQRAYNKALKIATAEEIDTGLDTFLYHFAPDDMKFCPHPATWLNQGRWMDEPEPPPLDWWERMANTERIRKEMKLDS